MWLSNEGDQFGPREDYGMRSFCYVNLYGTWKGTRRFR